tara:strand:+ start:2744 stop:3775 length:1032 start_codon:yes stop_codon:yes gene_type:complete
MSIGWGMVSLGRHPSGKMAPGINEAQNAHIEAVYSRDLGRAKEFAKNHNSRTAYDSYAELLKNPEVKVVYLASPNSLHKEQTIMAAKAGKHVLCEKPMALNISDCDEMIEACEKAGVHLGIAFHARHHPGNEKVKELVSGQNLGTVALIKTQWAGGVRGQVRPGERVGREQWWDEPSLVGAGTFMGNGVHQVDMMRWILNDEVEEVSAITDGQTKEQPLENLATLVLRFRSGSIGVLVSGRRIPDSQNDLVVYGSQGRAAVYSGMGTTLEGLLEAVGDDIAIKQEFSPPSNAGMYANMVEAFGNRINNIAGNSATGYDGMKVCQVTLAMIESARSKKTVSIAH